MKKNTPFGLSNLIRHGCSWVQKPTDHGLGTFGWRMMITRTTFDRRFSRSKFETSHFQSKLVFSRGFSPKHCTISPKVHVAQSCLPKGCLVHQTPQIFGAHGSRLTTVAVTRLRSTATLSLGVEYLNQLSWVDGFIQHFLGGWWLKLIRDDGLLDPNMNQNIEDMWCVFINVFLWAPFLRKSIRDPLELLEMEELYEYFSQSSWGLMSVSSHFFNGMIPGWWLKFIRDDGFWEPKYQPQLRGDVRYVCFSHNNPPEILLPSPQQLRFGAMER